MLRQATRAVDAAGVWLASVKQRWPRDAALRLDQWALKRTRLREELKELLDRVGRAR